MSKKRQKIDQNGAYSDSKSLYQNTQDILVMKQDVFYEAQQGTLNQMSREDSETIFVKKFNNFIKQQLINHFCFASRAKGLSVLDLCCGRGGDLGKWAKNGIAHYVGVDLSEALVVEAKRRYIESHVRKP